MNTRVAGKFGPVSAEARFWDKVKKTESCWLWNGASQSKGYGHLYVSGRHVLAHRYSWEIANGPIPAGMVIDHLCRVKSCVNPGHLEVVTPKENMMRGLGESSINAMKKACPLGHEYERKKNGRRFCRTCRNLNRRTP